MKHLYFLAICLLSAFSSQAKQANPELAALAQQYFNTMVATQAPNATKKELEAFINRRCSKPTFTLSN